MAAIENGAKTPAESDSDVRIDLSLIPPHVGRRIGAATVKFVRRIQHGDPELWAKVKARAAEIREGRAPEYGSK